MKKVLILIPNLKGGGAERVVVDLVNNFESLEYDVTLMTLYDKGINKKLISDKVKYRYFCKHQIRGIWRIYKIIPRKLLHKLIIKHEYDIEIAYLEGMATKVIAGGNENIRKIAWLHCELTNHLDYFMEMYRNIGEFREVYSKFNKIVCVSEDVKTSFQNDFLNGFSNLKVVHNVIDDERILYLAQQEVSLNISHDVLNFVSVGRLVEQKGYQRLLRIFNRLKNEKVHLYILGEGPDSKKLKEYIKKNNLSNVTMMGFQKNPYNIISKMDCYICSSFQEGFSTAVAESIILNVPIISTQCSGSRELCDSGVGIVCENSEEALYNTIKKYIRSKNIRDDMKNAVNEKRIIKQDSINDFIDLLDSCDL